MTERDNKRGRGSQTSVLKTRLSPIARELAPENGGSGEFHPKIIAGEPFTSGDPIRQYEAGRICASPGCETRLSIYNPTPFCTNHPATKLLVLDSNTPKSVRTKTGKPPKKRRRSK